MIEAAKKRAQQMKQSQLGSVAQTKRTVLSNNWTDQSVPLVAEDGNEERQPVD